MNNRVGKIGFENLTLHCIVGTLEEERTRLQPIFLDVVVCMDIGKAVKNDALAYTFDYRELFALAEKEAEKKHGLIETFAAGLLDALLDIPQVQFAKVKIRKPKALENGAIAFVEVEGGRP